jgi:hypothetical protein
MKKKWVLSFLVVILAVIITLSFLLYRKDKEIKLLLKKQDSFLMESGNIADAVVTTVTSDTAEVAWQNFIPDEGYAYAYHRALNLKEGVIENSGGENCKDDGCYFLRIVGPNYDGITLPKVVYSSKQKSHKIKFEGLKTNNQYICYISSSKGHGKILHFKTLKQRTEKPLFKIAVVSDLEIDHKYKEGAASELANKINAQSIDFVVLVGDNTKNAKMMQSPIPKDFNKIISANFLAVKRNLGKLKVPFYIVPGNHEFLYLPGVRESYRKIFQLENEYYSKTFKNNHFIFLSCEKAYKWNVGPLQYKWLEEQLKENIDKNIFIIFHYPIANDPYVLEVDMTYPDLQALLEKYKNVRVVFNGHKNVISTHIENGILYIICPQPNYSPYGYLTLTVYPDGVQQNFHHVKASSVSLLTTGIEPLKFSGDMSVREAQEFRITLPTVWEK